MNYIEDKIQKGLVLYFNLQYSHLKGLLCCNLNNSKDEKTGGRNKSLGVVAGRSDLVLYYNSTAYHIEVKQPDKKQSPVQKEWQQKIESQGFNYYLVHNLDEFMAVLKMVGL